MSEYRILNITKVLCVLSLFIVSVCYALDNNILVVGCTGATGTRALRGLLDVGFEPSRIRILTRNADRPLLRSLGFGIVKGDLDDPEKLRTLTETLRNDHVVGIYVHSTSKDTRELDVAEVQRARNLASAVAAAATDCGRCHLVYNSAAGEPNHGVKRIQQKHDVEKVFFEEFPTLTFTSLRANLFCEEFWKVYIRPSVISRGIFPFGTASDRTIHLTSVRDMGRLAGICIQRNREGDARTTVVGRVINVAGDALTAREIAQTFAEAQGSPCRHKRSRILALVARLFFRDLWEIIRFYRSSTETTSVDDLREEFPNLLTSFAEFLNETEWSDKDRTYEDLSDVMKELRR